MMREPGYSLIELLIAMTLMLLIIGGLYTVLFQTQGTFEAQQDVADLRQQARVAMSQLTTELRMTGFDIATVPQSLPSADAFDITFVADIDDGNALPPCGAGFETAVDGGAERVRYRVNGVNLLRTVDCWDGAGWNNDSTDQIVASDVLTAQPLFRYFDEAGAELVPGAGGLSPAERDDVRTVVITLNLQDPDLQVVGTPQVSFQLSKRVRLRNARIN